MQTSVRTIMRVRAKQRKTSLIVQGFKCQEIGHKRYLGLKARLNKLEELSGLEADDIKVVERVRKEVKEYEKKNNINKKPEKVAVEKKGSMSKVRSIFNRRNRAKPVGA